jgi:hypothetical protein
MVLNWLVASQRSGYDMAWACVGGVPPAVVLPGEERTDTLRIMGPSAYDGITHEPLGVLQGRFQIGYDTQGCASSDPSCSLAGSYIRSNVFDVRLAP